MLSKSVAAASETFRKIFFLLYRDLIVYCRCKEFVKLFSSAVIIQPNRDLWQCIELHFSLTDIEVSHKFIYYFRETQYDKFRETLPSVIRNRLINL
jgi:hypothetical protein